MRPLLLDLFCGAGGAAMGYRLAGFDVVGVDVEHQPNYPFKFVQWDALAYAALNGRDFDVIHASPPCQRYCAPSQYNGNRGSYPDYVAVVRELLKFIGKPWVIENTPGAPLVDPVVLCGTMFGLRVYRHRLFESSEPLTAPEHPKHGPRCARNGVLPRDDQFMTITGGKHSRAWTRAAGFALGVEWMTTTRAVCESIPPAYTFHIGMQLISHREPLRVS